MITVRRAQYSDCKGISDLLYEHDSRSSWDYRNGGPLEYYTVVIALSDGVVVGLLEGTLDSTYTDNIAPEGYSMPQSFIHSMFVAPEHRSQGTGAALLLAFAEQAAAAGLSFLALTADQNDGQERRVKFFRDCGLLPLDPSDPLWAFGAPVASLLGQSR